MMLKLRMFNEAPNEVVSHCTDGGAAANLPCRSNLVVTILGVESSNHESVFRMANIKSQIKRNRQNEKRNERNKALRSELKTRMKAAVTAAESGDAGAAGEALQLAQKRIDTAVSKGVLHKNTAARRKARLTRQVNDLIS